MLVEQRVMDVTSTLEGEKVGMTIHEDALAHIMSVLTDLYSDQELAVIREYSTNALDAHVEAGQTRPIEITLPTPLAPFFTIRDFGEGLDSEDIRSIYSKYGASTKRESNEVVGMLGLGCKSALTYSDQFTISGIKDGRRTEVSVSRDEDGSGSMTIVAEYDTDDHSGVEIVVPALRHNSFAEKSANFFRFWKQGTVLVNGEEPKRIDGLWLTDTVLVTEEADQDYIVMGNVPYPMSQDYDHYSRNLRTVAFVNIGDVAFTPSRESLQMTTKTKAKVAEIKETVKRETNAAHQRTIDAAPNHYEALLATMEAQRLGFDEKKPTYKNEEVLLSWESPQVAGPGKNQDGSPVMIAGPQVMTVSRDKYRGHRGWDRTRHLHANYWVKTVWFTNYEVNTDFTPTKRKKLEQFLAAKQIPFYQVTLVETMPFTKWVDQTKVFNWEDVAALKIIRETVTSNGRLSGSYDGYVDGARVNQILAADIDTSNPVFFGITDRDWSAWSAIRSEYPKHTYIEMSPNRINKFKRDFPMAVEARTQVKELAVKWVAGLTKKQKNMITTWENGTSELDNFDPTKIDDPDLKVAVEAYKAKSGSLYTNYQKWNGWVDMPKTKWTDPLSKYALVNHYTFYGRMSATFKDHLHLYLNAAFAAEQESN